MDISKEFVKPLESDIKSILQDMDVVICAMSEQSDDEEFGKYELDAESLKLLTNKVVSRIDRIINHIHA